MLKKNIIANFLGNILSSIIGFIVIPIYINLIGIEYYALIGIFATLQMIVNILDMGMSGTFTRETAKVYNNHFDIKKYVNFVFSLELVYFSIAIIACLILIIFAIFFSNQWVHTSNIPSKIIATSFCIMAFNSSLLFLSGLYQAGLIGFQKQIELNKIQIFISIFKSIGAIFILKFISNSIISFLIWQSIISLIQLIIYKVNIVREINKISNLKGKWDISSILENKNYTLGLLLISILAILLTQGDKIILSKLVLLSEFGYYTLAATVANIINMIVYPISSAIFPRIVDLYSRNKDAELQILFHKSCQFISFLIIPICVGVFIFSYDLLLFWTHNELIAKKSYIVLKFLIVGTTLNCFMNIPYQYSLANGWVKFGINISIVAVLGFLPIIYTLTTKYGILGSSFSWMALNSLYLIGAMYYFFSRMMNNLKFDWYFKDIFIPIIICLLVGGLFSFIKSTSNLINIALFIGFILISQISLFFLSIPLIRKEMFFFLNNKLSK